jgi:hypothetical protein
VEPCQRLGDFPPFKSAARPLDIAVGGRAPKSETRPPRVIALPTSVCATAAQVEQGCPNEFAHELKFCRDPKLTASSF